MAEMMSIDIDEVSMAVNKIAESISIIQSKNKAFETLLAESNHKTEGKFDLTKSLQKRISEEAQNIDGIVEAANQINEALNAYANLAAEASDDSAFRV